VLTTKDEFGAALDVQRKSVMALLGDLDEQQWTAPTRLPGWTIQDNLAHITSGACMLLGEPQPEHEIPNDLAHIRNDAGRWMEVGVDVRRPRAGADVLEEWAAKTAAVIDLIASEDAFQEEIDGPLGWRVKRSDILGIVVLDWWMHEQDMRDALARPGHIDGPVVDHGRDRMITALAAQLPEKVPGAVAGGLAIEIDDERRVVGDQDPPAITLSMPVITAGALCGGRGDFAVVRQAVKVQGDPGVAGDILAAMCFTP
jgi:uncharacterized protein (TIGR03083 family)